MATTGNGATLVNSTSAWAASIQSIGSLTLTRAALDDTDLSNDTYYSKTPDDLTEVGGIPITYFYDPDDPAPLGVSGDTWVLSFPYPSGVASGTQAYITGTAFMSETATPELVNGSLMMGTCTLQYDGNTGPQFVDYVA